MTRFLTILLLLLFLSRVMANTYTAPSVAENDVSDALSLAHNGDTVIIPAGSTNWTYVLNISQQINLIGAGDNATFITNNVPTSSSTPGLIQIGLTSGNSFRVSGIYFDGGWTSGCGILQINGGYYNPSKNNQIYGFRVDHCTFANVYYSNGSYNPLYGGYAFFTLGQVNGVVDHCKFIDCSNPFQFWGTVWRDLTYPSGPNGDTAWAECPAPYYSLGTTTNFVVESCSINTTRLHGGIIIAASQYPMHWVYRYNTFTNTLTSEDQQLFDMHGNFSLYASNPGYQRSVINTEIYENYFSCPQSSVQFILQRGGTSMIFTNTIVGPSSAPIDLMEEEVCLCGSDYFNPPGTYYPAQDQVTNSYYWGNSAAIHEEMAPGMVAQGGIAATYFQVNRDFWTNAPGPTNVLANYTPLVYPHPLLSPSPVPGGFYLNTNYIINGGAGIYNNIINSQWYVSSNWDASGGGEYIYVRSIPAVVGVGTNWTLLASGIVISGPAQLLSTGTNSFNYGYYIWNATDPLQFQVVVSNAYGMSTSSPALGGL